MNPTPETYLRRSGALLRALAAAAVVLASVVAGATPALAHGGALESTDFRARISQVAPRIPGLEIRLVEAGGRVELTNRTDEEAVVLGYEDEPYLRVGPDGVFRNRRSPATYLNARRSGGDPVPADATADAEPDWERIADGRTARWHDHRIHWMAPTPATVREHPGRTQRLTEWVVPVQVGARLVEVQGDITYVPGPAVWPWLAGAAVLGAVTVAAARRFGPRPVLLVALPLLLAADVTRVLSLTLALVGDVGDRLGQFLDVGLLAIVGWVLGAVAVARLARGHQDGIPTAGLAALLAAINGGVLEWDDLGHSQLAVAGPDDLLRICVAAATGLGVGIAGAVLLAVRRPQGTEHAA